MSQTSSLHLCLAVAVAMVTTGSVYGHEHHLQHSHFCEGGGYNLFCTEGLRLKIDRAWYGRVAKDKESCYENATEPELAKDCGSSIMESKDQWCKNADKGGCSIAVKGLEPAHEEVPCPDSVKVKYLYLEYECVDDTSGAEVPRVTVLYLSLVFAFCFKLFFSRS